MGSKFRFDGSYRFNRVYGIHWSYRTTRDSRDSRIKR
jgi:hypothetical protein